MSRPITIISSFLLLSLSSSCKQRNKTQVSQGWSLQQCQGMFTGPAQQEGGRMSLGNCLGVVAGGEWCPVSARFNGHDIEGGIEGPHAGKTSKATLFYVANATVDDSAAKVNSLFRVAAAPSCPELKARSKYISILAQDPKKVFILYPTNIPAVLDGAGKFRAFDDDGVLAAEVDDVQDIAPLECNRITNLRYLYVHRKDGTVGMLSALDEKIAVKDVGEETYDALADVFKEECDKQGY
jgi:hypothetical protein